MHARKCHTSHPLSGLGTNLEHSDPEISEIKEQTKICQVSDNISTRDSYIYSRQIRFHRQKHKTFQRRLCYNAKGNCS